MFRKLFRRSRTDYKSLIQQGAIAVDVRTREEFASGHAPKSINIPLMELGTNWPDLKNKKVVLVCRTGARSGQATHFLKDKGIDAYNAGRWQVLK